jgi:AmmeMemoRadiSam system protein B
LTDYPQVRSLEVIPIQAQGRTGILLRDPMRLSESTVIVPENIFFIISLMDGRHSARDIQEQYMRRYGELIYTEHVEKVAAELDQNLFLESERFAAHQRRVTDEFGRSEVVSVTPAGVGDLPEGQTLEAWLDDCLAAGLEADGPAGDEIQALIAPHIDLIRGRRVYGSVYRRLEGAPADALYILLGTSHQPTRGLVVPTAKDFQTPLGRIKTHAPAARRLMDLAGQDGGLDEIVHRTEHSLIFQMLFLQRLLGEVTILPVLCGTFSPLIEAGRTPEEDPEVRTWLGLFSEIMAEANRTILIAGADLAHIGPMFGDAEAVDLTSALASERADETLLDAAEAKDAARFFDLVAAEGDRRRICGLAPIWWLLALSRAGTGRKVDYQQWKDQHGQGSVSFAGLVF